MEMMLLGPVKHGEKGDPLERHYTNQRLARLVVRVSLEMYSDLLYTVPRIVLEPHVGGGNIIREVQALAPYLHTIGCDLDPNAEGLTMSDEAWVGDFLEWRPARDWVPDLVIGNPPFDDAVAHVEAACRTGANLVCFILPWGVGEAERGWPEFLEAHPPERVYRVRGRQFGKHCRNVAIWCWRPRPGCFRVIPKTLEVGP